MGLQLGGRQFSLVRMTAPHDRMTATEAGYAN